MYNTKYHEPQDTDYSNRKHYPSGAHDINPGVLLGSCCAVFVFLCCFVYSCMGKGVGNFFFVMVCPVIYD